MDQPTLHDGGRGGTEQQRRIDGGPGQGHAAAGVCGRGPGGLGDRLLFVAPAQEPFHGPFGWLDNRPRRVLTRWDPTTWLPGPVGPVDADLAAWREDGGLALLARLKDDGPLVLRAADETLGQTSHLVELPLRPPLGYAARWDLARARLLVASPAAGGSDALEYWLVRLGLDEAD